jgi:MFS family permease
MVALGGPRAPGLGAAALALVVAGFAWGFLRESRVPTVTTASRGTTPRAAIVGVLARWRDPASRLIWIYTVAIGAFYGTIQTVPLLLAERLGVTQQTVGYFVMYLGGMGVVVRAAILGRAVDRLGEIGLARLGVVLLAAGLGATGLAHDMVLMGAAFTLMPLGTAFLFPCVTGLLSRVVPARQRGLYMGVQHTFGGVSRVAFPVAAGLLMDRYGVGVPFLGSALLVLLTLPLTRSPGAREVPADADAAARQLAAADITGEIRVEPGDGRA